MSWLEHTLRCVLAVVTVQLVAVAVVAAVFG